MRPLSIEEIQTLQEYELARPDFRQSVIAMKKRRRVALGPVMTVVFENRETVRFQVQEMLRIERIVRPDKVQEEIDVYNELLPGPNEVAATLFLEVTDLAEVQPTLDRFIGLDEPGRLVLSAGAERSPARFAAGQSREDRISAVHYIRFPLPPAAREAIVGGRPVTLSVDHEGYRASAPLPEETVAELARDLAQP
jgi:hypothetical protein